MYCRGSRENAFLGAGFLLIPARAAKGGVEAMCVERGLQCLSFHDLSIIGSAVIERIDVARHTILVGVDDQLKTVPRRHRVAEFDHLAEFPGGIDMQHREGQLRGVESFQRQMQQHRAILADGIHHHRIAEAGHRLAENLDGFRFKRFQIGGGFGHHTHTHSSLPMG